MRVEYNKRCIISVFTISIEYVEVCEESNPLIAACSPTLCVYTNVGLSVDNNTRIHITSRVIVQLRMSDQPQFTARDGNVMFVFSQVLHMCTWQLWASLLEHKTQILVWKFDCWVEKPCYTRKTPLVIDVILFCMFEGEGWDYPCYKTLFTFIKI